MRNSLESLYFVDPVKIKKNYRPYRGKDPVVSVLLIRVIHCSTVCFI